MAVEDPAAAGAPTQLGLAPARGDHRIHEPRPRQPPRLNFIAHSFLRGGLRPAAPPYTLARGDPFPPLRSRGSPAAARSPRPCHLPFPPRGFAPPHPPPPPLPGTPSPRPRAPR